MAAQSLHPRLPPLAIALSVGGLIPFVGLGFAAVSVGDEAQARALLIGLIGYGAVILGFLGAVHWGLALAGYGGPMQTGRVARLRLGLGVVPALLGWAALLIGLASPYPSLSLGLLIAGFVGVVVIEARARRDGLVPNGYMGMRWTITICVVAVLAAVALLRLANARLVV